MDGAKKKEAMSLEEKIKETIVPAEESPYEVPSNWCWIKNNIVCKLGDGLKSEGEMLPYLEVKYLRGVKEAEILTKGKLIDAGTKVILVDGENSGEVFDICEKGYIGSTFRTLVITNGICDKYLLYFIHSKKDLLRNNKKGSAIPHLNKKVFFDLDFPLPPKEEQNRIVKQIESMFMRLDEAQSKLELTLEESETRKTAILYEAFKGELTKGWRERHKSCKNTVIEAVRLYSNTLSNKDKKLIAEGQAVQNPIEMSGGIVWYETKIGAISRVTNGSTPSRQCEQYWNGDIPWVSSGEVRNNIIDVTEEQITREGYDSSSVKLLPKGTVLIAMIGEGKTRGQSAVLNIEATTNQNIAAIIIEHGQINSKFLWYWLQKEYKKNREKGAGSGPQALNCQRVRELDMIVPPIEEQGAIVEIIDELMQKEMQVIETINEVIDKISFIKKSILAKAFHGELGTNNPNEESAVELLKSILAEAE